MKRRLGYVVGLFVAITGNSTIAQGEEPKFRIRESDFVMSQDEASKFSAEAISPILIEFARGNDGPEALRSRLQTLVKMINNHEIVYVASPAYYPVRELHALAKVERFQSETFVVAFIPELMDWRARLSPSDFRYGVLVTFAHEMIHLELGRDPQFRQDKNAAKAEAVAWGITVLEIIRPLEAQGLSVPEYKQLSTLLKSLKDDYTNSRWLKNFQLR